jgi:hypothetical protein
MFHQKKQSNPTQKRKSIEIYFILYLVALVMLISGGKDIINKNDDNNQFSGIEFPFRIKSEKPLLTCKVITDTNGQKQCQLDSINYIFDYGNVKDVKYEFVVEDAELKHRILLSNNEIGNQIFSFIYDDKNRTVIFRWYPNIENAINKTFNVYVTATATHIGKTSQKLKAKTQFALVITNDYLSNTHYEQIVSNNNNISNTFSPQSIPRYYQPQMSPTEFNLKSQAQIIKGIAGDTWENEIVCYGFNPKIDLLKSPVIEINNTPNDNGASITSNVLKDNSIFLKGKVPDVGKSKVLVSVQRKGDLKEQKIYFDIYPISIQLPNVPSTMFPNIEYSITPNVPSDMNDIASYIKEKENDKVRFRSFNNSIIKFLPNSDDIGKILTFERYYNGKLIGQKYQIKVIDFPSPQITRLSEKNDNEIILETISYGIYNGMYNTINEVKLSGNAKYTQKYGKTHINRSKFEFIEQFLITPNDYSKPFKFNVYIIDQSGKSSSTQTKE